LSTVQTSPGFMATQAEIKPESGKRLLFIDNLRWLMIVFVVIMHLNVTYSSFGSWYYIEKRSLDLFSTLLFAIYGSFTQAYFMGFLFLIAGYFVPGAYDKKGPGKFMADRLFRLGIPTLFYMLIIEPLNALIRGSFDHAVPTDLLKQYWNYISSFQFIGSSGPLWFALALLIFSVIYGLIRAFIPKTKLLQRNEPFQLTHTYVIVVILLISLGAFLLRWVQPIGTSFYNMQLCYFSAYIVLFILGIWAYRHDLFLNIPYRFGMTWFKIALWGGIPLWMVMIVAGGAMNGMTRFNGGLYWQSIAYALWESFFCVGVCLGLLVLFREKYNHQGKISKFLSNNAFGVYVFHAPILIALTLTARGIFIYPLLKMLLMTIIIVPVCFGFSGLIRTIPWFRKVFS
jgi:glucan biosynthesis protein C